MRSYIRGDAVKEMHRNNCRVMSESPGTQMPHMPPKFKLHIRWSCLPDTAFLLAQSNSRSS
jgi:hypothetical protein